MMQSPATVSPFSGSSACSMPICAHVKVVGDRHVRQANSLNAFAVFRGFDVLVRDKMVHAPGQSCPCRIHPAYPAFSISVMATGVVMSLPRTRSSFASISCPASTDRPVRHGLPESSVSLSFPYDPISFLAEKQPDLQMSVAPDVFFLYLSVS